jgi:hypothetical protein
MSRIKTIAVQRVKNLGNYESERLELTLEIDEYQDFTQEQEDACVQALRVRVRRLLDHTLPKQSPPVIEVFDNYDQF